MKTKYTPGPWAIDNLSLQTGTCSIVSYDNPDSAFGTPVASIIDKSSDNELLPNERTANARLIVAAPELLEMLEEAHAHLEYYNYGASWERECTVSAQLPERIEEVIRKAKGG